MGMLRWIIRPRVFFWCNALYAVVLTALTGHRLGWIVGFIVCNALAIALQIGLVAGFLLSGLALRSLRGSAYELYSVRFYDYAADRFDPKTRWHEMFSGAPNFNLQDIIQQAKAYGIMLALCLMMPAELVAVGAYDALHLLIRRPVEHRA